ncbi:MAG: 1-deoxy-D-xylulose-5-phosphate reductoisomerase [Clostridia bacterium]|nr:1-deoxy-D-xylulose-5-phosphate reductoisomerase [Clostridia bacterium]
MKRVAILGSTGSIGKQALEVLSELQDFSCVALSIGGGSVSQLNDQLLSMHKAGRSPLYVGVSDMEAAEHVHLFDDTRLIAGSDAASIIAKLSEVDIVINGISGFLGLFPLLSATNAGKTVALANKESIVCGHMLLKDALKKNLIIPVDSEQSAIFQCLTAGQKGDVSRLILTASGGAFRDLPDEALFNVAVSDALSHPNWSMGKRITIDSASMFNKGLEILEAAYLFGTDNVEAVLHRQSIVHSMVEFDDGSIIAQLAKPDMKLAIQYAITYPRRLKGLTPKLDLTATVPLTFEPIDTKRYRAIPLAYDALSEGNVLPIAYNAADEEAVLAFLSEAIRFTDIAGVVETAMNDILKACGGIIGGVEDIIEIDEQARLAARLAISHISKKI